MSRDEIVTMATASTPTPYLPPLQGHDRRVQNERHERPDHHEQHDVTEAVEELARQIDEDDDSHGDQDRAQGNLFDVGPSENPRPSGAGSARSWTLLVGAHR